MNGVGTLKSCLFSSIAFPPVHPTLASHNSAIRGVFIFRPSAANTRPAAISASLQSFETRALVSLARDLVVDQKLFLCRVGRGAIPRPVGFARPYSSREKRSPRRRLRTLRVRPMGESSLRTASGSAVHFGTRAAFRERQSPQLPTKPVAARGGFPRSAHFAPR